MVWRRLILSLLLPLSTLSALAQETAPEMLPEIIVQAPGERAVENFVGDVLDRVHGDQLARWHQPICTTLRGFSATQAQAFDRRLQEAATQVGMEPPRSGCKPNAVILLTDQPNMLIDHMLSTYPGIFAPAGPSEVRRELAAGGTVRVWSTSVTNGAQGTTPDIATKGSAVFTSVKLAPGNATRLGSGVRADLFRTVVILDVNGLRGLPLDATADHVAMRLLGRTGEAEQTGVPTILSLFRTDGGPRPLAMTDWDRALLRELYRAPVTANADRQRRQIARRLTDTAAAQP